MRRQALRRFVPAILLAALSESASGGSDAASSPPSPANPTSVSTPTASSPTCASEPAMHWLDFWLGYWTVSDKTGETVGTNRIERVAEGCAVMETWHDPDGSETRGLFYFRPASRQWQLVLVTGQALTPGGLRERHLVSRGADGSLLFEGEYAGLHGPILNRMTATPISAGRVRELIEVSRDRGATWTPAFDAIYRPAAASPRIEQ